MTLRIAAVFGMDFREVDVLPAGEWAHLAAYCQAELKRERRV